jgi:hypothetical protein
MVDSHTEKRLMNPPVEMSFVMDRFISNNRINPKINLSNLITQREFTKKSKEIITPLNLIEPFRLEQRTTDERLDVFIRDALLRREVSLQALRRPFVDVQDVPAGQIKKRFNSASGLYVATLDARFLPAEELTINGERVVIDNGEYSRIDFTPNGRTRFDAERMTDSLAKGIQGIIELLDAIGHGDVQLAPVFAGTTNINMALIAQRLGFKIVDSCRTADGNINKDLSEFIIVG